MAQNNGSRFSNNNQSTNNNEDSLSKITNRVFATTVIAAFGGFIVGYEFAVSGGVSTMNPFLKKFFPEVYEKEHNMIKDTENIYCKFDSQILTWFTSSLCLAALVASLLAFFITRVIGRRLTIIISGGFVVVGAAVNGSAHHLSMLIIGRVLLGFGIGLINQTVPNYLTDVAPKEYKKELSMMFHMAISTGILVANVLNFFFRLLKDGEGWRLSLGFTAVPAIMIIIPSLCLPDSPSCLIERGKIDKAKENLIKIRETSRVDEQEFNDLVAASENSNNSWTSLFKRRQYRPQLIMAIAIPLFQQLTGINVIIFFAPILFKTIGFSNGVSLIATVVIGIFNSVATFDSIAKVDKYGRRALFLEGGIVMFISQLLITIGIACKFGINGNPSHLPAWYSVIGVIVISTYVIGFAWSWGLLGWLLPYEIFPLEIRSAAQSTTITVNMIFTFAIVQTFTTMLCHAKFGMFILFTCFIVVMTTFMYKLLPETNGVPIEGMLVAWQNHPFWNKFVNSDNDERQSIGPLEPSAPLEPLGPEPIAPLDI